MEQQKLVLDELQSVISRQRSYSYGDVMDDKSLSDDADREKGSGISYEKKDKSIWRNKKNKGNLNTSAVEDASMSSASGKGRHLVHLPLGGSIGSSANQHSPLERSRTLPNNVSKRFQESLDAINNMNVPAYSFRDETHEQKKAGYETKSKSFNFKNKLSKLTRTISTRRTPKHKKPRRKASGTKSKPYTSAGDNLSDSETYDNIAPLSRSLKATYRLSRSLDQLDDLDGYDRVDSTGSIMSMGNNKDRFLPTLAPRSSEKEREEGDNAYAYETYTGNDGDVDDPYSRISGVFLQTDSAIMSTTTVDGTIFNDNREGGFAMTAGFRQKPVSLLGSSLSQSLRPLQHNPLTMAASPISRIPNSGRH